MVKEKDFISISPFFFFFFPEGCARASRLLPRVLYILICSLYARSLLFSFFFSPLLIVLLFARFPFNGAQVAEKLRPTRVSRNSTNSLGMAQTTSSSLGSEMIVLWCPIDSRERARFHSVLIHPLTNRFNEIAFDKS